MSKTKKTLMAVLLIVITAVYILTTVLDFSRVIGAWTRYTSLPVEYIKRINVLMAAGIILLAGKNSLSLQDQALMVHVFLVILMGEAFFLAGQPEAAIVCFALCQILLTKRHGKGIFAALKKAGKLQIYCLLGIGLLLALSLVMFIDCFHEYDINSSLFLVGCCYGLILCISLWTGLANDILALYPSPNSRMIAAGMLCFFCCDILVGLDGLLGSGLLWQVARSLIWVFYTPAITLLALSCCRYKKASPRKISL